MVRRALVHADQPDVRQLGAGAVRQCVGPAGGRAPRAQAAGARLRRGRAMNGVRDRLIFALDVPTAAEARSWVDRLGDSVTFYKIGMELLTSGDYFRALDDLAARGKHAFVDLKFHDVPAT